MLVYDGGVLTAGEIAAITVPPDELAGFALVPPERISPLVRPALDRRIRAALTALTDGSVASLEDGYPAG